MAVQSNHTQCICASKTTIQKVVIGLAIFYAWARAKHFGCHYPCVGVSSEGIAVVLCVCERECVCVCVLAKS